MSGEHVDQRGYLYRGAEASIKRGKRFWQRSYQTRLHVPVTNSATQPRLAVNPTGSIDRTTTARMTGEQTRNITLRMADFQLANNTPIPQLGAPQFADRVEPIKDPRTFSGYELELYPDGLCLLRGVVDLKPLEISGLAPHHTARVAEAWVAGLMTHTGTEL